jgi:GT2 family glycosyltransferase
MQQHSNILADVHLQQQPVLPDITVIIPTLGRVILQESLYRIASGSCWPAQIIVVDQGQNVQVAHWMERLKSIGMDTVYVPSSEQGRAAGINRGIERVTTRFVAVTDDDCFVDTNWVRSLESKLRENPDSIVTGRVEQAGDAVVPVVVTSRKRMVYRRPRLTFDALSGGNMGTSMAVIERVGLFDEDSRLRTAEDGEWAYRALRAGIQIIYEPEVIVAHYGWRDESKRNIQYRDYARSHGGFYGMYLRKGDWFIAFRVLVHHFRAMRRWLRGVVSGNREQTLQGRAYLTGLFPGIIAGMRKSASL